MEKKIIINRIDLGQRVTGYELFNPGVNGGEIIGLTAKQLCDAVKAGEVIGVVLDNKGGLKLDESKGFKAIMVKTGVGTLNSTDSSAVANIMYTVYDRDGDNFKVINSRFGRQRFCMDKVKALLELGAVNGVFMAGDSLVCGWELDEGQDKPQEATEGKKKGA